MKTNHHSLLLFLCLIILGCKKDSEPAIRYTLEDVKSVVNCLNCKDVAYNGKIVKYSSVSVSFTIDGDVSLIGSESYLRAYYNFDGNSPGEFIISKKDLALNGKVMSFESTWYYGSANAINLEMILYTGRGRKSETCRYTIRKPSGAN